MSTARILAAVSAIALCVAARLPAQDVGAKCPDDCVYKPGVGFICDMGTAGCQCHDESGCWYYNCDGGPACQGGEEEEEEVLSPGGSPRTLEILTAGGELFVVLDGCLRRVPLMLPLTAHTSVEIVEVPSAAAGHD